MSAGADPAAFALDGEAYTGPGRLYHSEFLDGLLVDEAKKKIADFFGARAVDNRKQGVVEVSYRSLILLEPQILEALA